MKVYILVNKLEDNDQDNTSWSVYAVLSLGVPGNPRGFMSQ